MILRTFKKYGTDGGSFAELPGSHRIPEGDMTSSAARGRGLSRKIPMEPPQSSSVIEGGSSSPGVNDLEKSRVEQRISVR